MSKFKKGPQRPPPAVKNLADLNVNTNIAKDQTFQPLKVITVSQAETICENIKKLQQDVLDVPGKSDYDRRRNAEKLLKPWVKMLGKSDNVEDFLIYFLLTAFFL